MTKLSFLLLLLPVFCVGPRTPLMCTYYLHVHKSGGTQFCRVASKIRNTISGTRNCGPTLPRVRGRALAFQKAKDLFPTANEQRDTAYIEECFPKRVTPDNCCVWLKSNANLDAMRLWPKSSKYLAKTAYEVEIPIWDYTDYQRHEAVLKAAGNPTFVANERYISPVIEQIIHTPLDKRSDPYCVVVVMRNAVDRAYSNFRFDIRSRVNVPKHTSQDAYLDKYLIDNLSTRMLCGRSCLGVGNLTQAHFVHARDNLRALDAVLLMGNMALGTALVEKQCKHVNENKGALGRLSADTVEWTHAGANAFALKRTPTNSAVRLRNNPQMLQRYEDVNGWDTQLYAEAEQLYEQAIARHGMKLGVAPPLPATSAAMQNPSSVRISSRYNVTRIPIDQVPQTTPQDLVEDGPIEDWAPLTMRFVRDYTDGLLQTFADLVPEFQLTRIKFPSIFTSPRCGGTCVLVNLRDDNLCHGLLGVFGVASPDDYTPRLDSVEVLRGDQGYLGSHTIASTGAEDGRAISSPDGQQAYLVFNFLRRSTSRVIGIIDYNGAPEHVMYLTIKDVPLRSIEKNWTPLFLQKDGGWVLHVLYTIDPTVVAQCKHVRRDAQSKRGMSQCTLLGDSKHFTIRMFDKVMLVRGSSPLIEYRWPHYVGLVHTRRNTAGKGRSKHLFFNKPCYRSELMVLNVETFDVVYFTGALQLDAAHVAGLGRSDAQDTYNQYATGLYRSPTSGKVYAGIDVDDMHPVISEIMDLDEVLGNATMRKLNVHQASTRMRSTLSCNPTTTRTAPFWAKLQRRCPKTRRKERFGDTDPNNAQMRAIWRRRRADSA